MRKEEKYLTLCSNSMRNTSLDVNFLKITNRKKNQVLLSKVIKTFGGTREFPPRCVPLSLVECQLRSGKMPWISFDNEKHRNCYRGSFKKISLFPRLTRVVNDFRDITFNCVYMFVGCDCHRKRLMMILIFCGEK